MDIMAGEGETRKGTFECRQCGVCCSTQKIVLLTLPDIFRMAEKLGMKPGAFYKRYCMKSARFHERGLTRIYLKTEGGCPFLKDRKCSVHEFKPIVCAQSPFYFFESSLAVLKTLGMIVPGCTIEQLPYSTITFGDEDQIIDMEIELNATDEYIGTYKKFEEKSAREALAGIQLSLCDAGARGMVRARLIDECARREEMYRKDPYYRGATNMYLSGFYDELRQETERARAQHPELINFEPAAVGTGSGLPVVILPNSDYVKTLARLKGVTGDIFVKASVRSDIEYSIVTIVPDGRQPVLFYFHLEPGQKASIIRTPGKVTFDFHNARGERFKFTGRDCLQWLS